MKRTIILLISVLLLNLSNLRGITAVGGSVTSDGDSIKVLSSPDLYNLSTQWAGVYNRLHPGTKIKIISIPDSRMAENLNKEGSLGFVSNENYSGFQNESLWRAVVGRDVIVPVINSNNPFLEEIAIHGISPEAISKYLNDPVSATWGTLLNTNEKAPVRYYSLNDESVSKGIEEFLQLDQKKITGVNSESDENLISAIQNDKYAIGFCKMVNVLDFKDQALVENISLLPIDRNGNGLLDYNENIYDDFNAFSRGVWIGKYPKTLFSTIYSIAAVQPKNETEIAFLKWVLTDGQKFLYSNGYSELLVTERQTTVDSFNTAEVNAVAVSGERSLLKVLMFVITSIILAGLIIEGIARYRRKKKVAVQTDSYVSNSVLNENTLIVPAGIYFDKTHTWAFMEQNGMVKVGIDDFLQHITGTITRIKMKNPGEKVKKGEQILSIIQNGKQLNLYSPLSGVVREQNTKLDSNSSVINSSPYNDGWVYRIEPSDWLRENQLLFMAQKHRLFLKNEFSRLKDFLAVALSGNTELYPQLVLQDGGELKDGILSNLGPEIWEDFQTKYIDPSRQIWFYELY